MSSLSTLPKPILTLENDICIRPFHASFAEALSIQGNNRKIWLNLTDRFPHPYTVADAIWWINHCNDPATFLPINQPPTQSSPDTNSDLSSAVPSNYTICHLDSPIGTIGLETLPRQPHSLALGYWLGEDYWGQGIATKVASAFLKWTFNTFPWCVRIEANAYSWNEGSMKVLRKIGMEFEGRQKLAVVKGDRYGDLVLFGIVRPGFVPDATEGGENEDA